MPICDELQVQDRITAVNGLRFHYRDWGSVSAPPLVLLHGFLFHARLFDALARLMSDHYRVLAVDQRGHGETDWADHYGPEVLVEDLAAVVEVLGLQRLSLLGYSFGGPVAYTYAAHHPERVRRLVLVESGGVAAPPSPRWEAEIGGWRGVPRPVETPEAAERALRAVLPRATGEALGAFVRAGLTPQADGHWAWRWDPQLLAAQLPPTAEFMWRTLPNVRCPTLLVRDADSACVPLEVAERMVAALPHGELANIADAGHWTWFENPAGIEAVIREFLLREPDLARGTAGQGEIR